MSRRIFISYSRNNRDIVSELADTLKEMGHEVWFDTHLYGGYEWWDAILREIRECDVFLFAMTPEAMDSELCKAELIYARALKRFILPVKIMPVSSYGDVALFPILDYLPETPNRLDRLLDYVEKAPPRAPLPDPPLLEPAMPVRRPDQIAQVEKAPPRAPLPDSPLLESDVPIRRLDEIAQIVSAPRLPENHGDVMRIFWDLKTLLEDPKQAYDAQRLLRKLHRHSDLRAPTMREIDQISRQLGIDVAGLPETGELAPEILPRPTQVGVPKPPSKFSRSVETPAVQPDAHKADPPSSQPPSEKSVLKRVSTVVRRISKAVLQSFSVTDESDASQEHSGLKLTAYYPTEAVPEMWAPLHAYLLLDAAADAVQADAQSMLGEQITAYRKLSRPAQQPIEAGALVTATPHLPGMQVNPPSANIAFFEDFHRFDFKIRAKGAPLHQAVNGFITFTVEGVIVADVPVAIFVTDTPTENAAQQQVSAAAYNAVFCSYSHRDTPVVERVERAFQALGIDYLRDVHTLRSGQHWSDELIALIDRADIFQLFWSEAASQSEYVEQEWRHALSLTDRDAFIRPVYWQQPIPPVPDELSHIHFQYQRDL